MLVQLLTVPNCPYAEPAAAVVRQALDQEGLSDVPVTAVTVDTEAEAARLGFPGSPTILIDGHDPFPEPTAGQPLPVGSTSTRMA
jgi:hypothetical protein